MQDPLPGLELERPGPPAELVAQARAYSDRKKWIFAKTMADNPHWYTVLFNQSGADRDGYLALRELITRYGWKAAVARQPVADVHPRRPRLLDDPSCDQPQAQRRGGLGGFD